MTELESLKKSYEVFKKKHELPDFGKLNEDFQIEKIAESETDFLIREVRKFMGDKFANYMRFIETLFHPTNAPIFVFTIIKTLKQEEKDILAEVYKKLSKFQVQIIHLDVEYNEQREIDFIKKADKDWQIIKKDLSKVLDFVDKNWDSKIEVNNKCYFG